ncbi:hypothetical protein CR105_21815 [Massilia eurypsychrophila]|uniref:ABC transporter substrate-binding protein n=1 Tax=Massilia eurypsychrophila TaxID=1485217 RepID=A0A2G8T9Y1_9BURK|nr:hypothetical protein [Massilia eurypsychrophila]PIL42867.1 hypothetical protein CR105_21815 [Massilia eurypsychrophila]
MRAGARRRLLAAALFALAVPFACAEQVHGYRFHIVTGDDSAQTRRIADDLYKRLVPLSAMFRTELAQRRRMVYIAIGPAALRDVAARKDDCVVISAFTSSAVWRTVAAGATPARAVAMTAVYAEPAPASQLQLAALLYRRPVRTAVILGADTAHLKSVLHGAAALEELAPGEDINRVLNRIASHEVLLAMPDSGVYNVDTVRNILLSTYRHKQGVIGFSADMVKAGALASTYSEIEDINAQVAEMAAAFVATGELAPPQFPRYFHTIINEGVARSLDLDVGSAARTFARRAPARPR